MYKSDVESFEVTRVEDNMMIKTHVSSDFILTTTCRCRLQVMNTEVRGCLVQEDLRCGIFDHRDSSDEVPILITLIYRLNLKETSNTELLSSSTFYLELLIDFSCFFVQDRLPSVSHYFIFLFSLAFKRYRARKCLLIRR